MSEWGADSGILRNKKVVQGQGKPEELLVFGYACKLFRDDEKALHIDQGKHLIPWMGNEALRIDRYDGRGTLSNLAQYEASKEGYDTIRWLGLSESERKLEELCDAERYYSLEINEEEEELYKEEEAKRKLTNAFQYSYNEISSASAPNKEPEPDGIPTVPEFNEDEQPYVPSPLLDVPVDISIPQTIKEYARIEKTALFVCKQGQQMEILIKTKQSDNAQFSFLTQTDPLYKFYRHLLAAFKNGRYQQQHNNATESKKQESGNAEDSDENHYLHPSLVSTKKADQTQVVPPPPVALPYQPSANCAYSQLVTRIQGTTSSGTNSTNGQAEPPVVVEEPPAHAQLTVEQHQYYQYYYLHQYYNYYRQMVQTDVNGAYVNLPPEFHQLDPAMQNFVHQLAFGQYVQHCQQQQQPPPQQQLQAQPIATVPVVDETGNSYAQIVSNLNKDGVNPYAANVPQLPQKVEPLPVGNEASKNKLKDVVAVKKTLLSLAAAYGSDSDTEDEDNADTKSSDQSDSDQDQLDGKEVVKPEIKIPPSDTQVIIDKMADYVFKNGEQFEGIIKAKNDPRFDFLNADHEFYEYYKKKLRELKGEKEPEVVVSPKKVKKKEKKPKKVIAPVSFSIKKTKEEPSKEIKSALPLEESSDEEQDKLEKNKDQNNSVPNESAINETTTQQGNFAKTVYNIQDQTGSQKLTLILENALATQEGKTERDAAKNQKTKGDKKISEDLLDSGDSLDTKDKRVEDKLKDKLAAVAREKLASVAREKALQLERKRKAAAFLKLKAQGDTTGTSTPTDSSSLSSLLLTNVQNKNRKVKDAKKPVDADAPIFEDLPPKPKKKAKTEVTPKETAEENSTNDVQERLENRLDVSTSTTEQTKSSDSESSSGDCEIVGVSLPQKKTKRSRSKSHSKSRDRSRSREKTKHKEKKRKTSHSPISKKRKEKKKKSHKKKHAKSSHESKHKKKSKERKEKKRHRSRTRSRSKSYEDSDVS